MTATRRPTGRSSAPHTPISADSFALSGPSNLPDPAFHAYRRDLADRDLAGQVIASHYAEPLPRVILAETPLFAGPAADSETLARLDAGDPFEMLDNSLGWAWGYGGRDRRVGYVPADRIGAA